MRGSAARPNGSRWRVFDDVQLINEVYKIACPVLSRSTGIGVIFTSVALELGVRPFPATPLGRAPFLPPRPHRAAPIRFIDRLFPVGKTFLMNASESQQLLNEEHLRLLRIGYLIEAGLSIFLILVGLFYAGLGAMMLANLPGGGRGGPGGPPPAFIGGIFLALGLGFALFGALLGTLRFLTARALRLRRARTLCLITAGLTCLSIPYGTALGIMTFIVLARPGVQRMFAEGGEPAPVLPPVAGVGDPGSGLPPAP
jgi:hypothetical protein